jgi:hypothetical protein
VSFDFGCCSLAQMSFVDHYLSYFRFGLSSACCQSFCPSSLCLLKVCVEISSLLLPLSLVQLQHPCPFCCVFPFSSLFIVQFFFFCRAAISPGGYAGLSQGCLREYRMTVGAHLLVSQAGLEPASGGMGALLFFSV